MGSSPTVARLTVARKIGKRVYHTLRELELEAAVQVRLPALGRALSNLAALGPRPVKWCMRLSASSSLDGYAAAAIAITSSAWSSGGSVSALAIDSTLM